MELQEILYTNLQSSSAKKFNSVVVKNPTFHSGRTFQPFVLGTSFLYQIEAYSKEIITISNALNYTKIILKWGSSAGDPYRVSFV